MRILLLTTILLLTCVPQPDRTVHFGRWTPPDDMELDRDTFLSYLITEGSSWIRLQREILRPTAATVPDDYRERYALYFRPETLDKVRFQLVDKIENPGFYDELTKKGMDIPLDFSKMDGITFVDTIAVTRHKLRNPDLNRLLFHECVHVAQYEYLGMESFVSQYVHGWAENGFDYFAIPLEEQAYELERRFARGETFSVEDVVAATFDQS